jgi:PAS domain S-box-containing protein
MHLAQTAANLGTWELDLRTGNAVWSDGIWRLLNLPVGATATTLQSWLDHIHPDDRERVRQGLSATRPQRLTDFYREYRLLVAGGAVRWVASKGQIVCDDSGNPVETFGACYDITERRLAEEAVRETSDRLQLGMEAGNTGTWDWDIPANRVTWSKRIYDMHGLTPETFGGRVEDFQRMIHADDAERVGAAIKKAIESRAPYQIEFRVVHPTGEVRWLTTTGKVFFSDDGKPMRMMGATSDITARKDAERERDELFERERAARAEAERASEAKSEFLATLSHELRTPLTPVLLTASLLENRRELPDDVRRDLSTIRRNVELESRLISDLLDLTRITRGKLELDLQDVDLHLIIRAAADICVRESSAPVRLELNAARPTVRGDSTRLTQIFWNLINNAQKFTPPDGSIVLRTSDDAARDVIRIELSDTGVGIDHAVLPRLFSAFEQGEVRAARTQAGLGLGLSISRKLAEAHGGTVTAQSPGRNRGATFVVELPVAVHAPYTPSTTTAPAPAPSSSFAAHLRASAAQMRPLNVLLVEDHAPTLEVLTRLLEILGHKVTPANSVESARAAASDNGIFDILISDLGLPDGTGLDVMRHIGPRYAGRAIALTGYGMESDIMATRSVGFAEHLIKPVDLATLQNAIARVSR